MSRIINRKKRKIIKFNNEFSRLSLQHIGPNVLFNCNQIGLAHPTLCRYVSHN